MRNTIALYRNHLIASVCTALLLGCTVGPDYKKPEAHLPTTWQSSQNATMQADIEQSWWQRFRDPVLDDLISKAVSGNFDLKIAEARIAEARATRSASHAELLPQFSAAGTDTREANQLAFPNAPFDLAKPFNVFQTGFDASWEVDLFGGKRRGVESATAELQAAEASRDEARISMLAEVARTYVDIRQYQMQLDIANETVKSDQESLKIAQDRFHSGSAPELDATRANAQLTQSQSRIPYYQSLLTQAEYSMDVLLGDNPGTAHTLVATVKPVPVGDKFVALAGPADVIANRPDIRMAERKLASATAQQGVATAELFPDISLSGFLGFLSTDSNTLFNAASKSWNLVGGITVPVLNYAKINAHIDAANARQQEAFLEYQKSIAEALSDVERSATAYSKEEEHRALLNKSVGDNRHAVEIIRMRYKEGLSSFLEVLDADRTLYTSQSQAAEADAKASQDLIALYKSLGGGWKDTKSADKPTAK